MSLRSGITTDAASVRHGIGHPDTLSLSACDADIPKAGISAHGPLGGVEPWSPRCFRSPE